MSRALRVRPRLLVGLLGLFALVVAITAPAASAQVETVPVSGEFSVTLEEENVVLDAPGVTIVHFTEAAEFSGDISGEARASTRCIFDAEGQADCFVIATFEGSVAGRSGTAEFHVHFEFNVPEDSLSGNAIAIGTSGELAGAFGQLAVEGSGGEGSYSGEFTFLS